MSVTITIETETTVYEGKAKSYEISKDGNKFKIYASGDKLTQREKE